MSFIPESYPINDSHKRGGGLQVVDSVLYFSPNSTRVLTHIPTPHTATDNSLKNPFLPAPNKSGHYAFDTVNASDYQSPLWWTPQFEWAAFIHRFATFEGPILGILNQYKVHEKEEKGFGMPLHQVRGWSGLERDLSFAIVILAKCSGTSLLLPVLPSIFGYKRFFKTEQEALQSIKRSREWFALWIGAFCYVVFAMEAKNKLHPHSMSWEDILISSGCHPVWIEGILASGCLEASAERSGVLLCLERDRHCIHFFLNNNVPVWYKWNDQPEYAAYGPTNEQRKTILDSPPEIANPKFPWVDFFAKRELENQRTESLETQEQKQRRLNRLRQPPQASGRVFEWVQDESETWIRQPVAKRFNLSTLEFYDESCIRYDSFRNEFDCCEMFNVGKDSTECFTEDELRTFECVDKVNESFSNPYETPVDTSMLDDTLPPQAASFSTVDALESHIQSFCSLQYGFTGPLPNIHPIQSFDIAAQKNFLKLLGIEWTEERAEVFNRGSTAAVRTFLDLLASKNFSRISKDEWDLSLEHRQTMHLNARLKMIRKLVAVDKIYYMFLLPDNNNWHITTTCASHALMVCRLDCSYNSRDVAMYMVNQGMPFHTMQASKTLSRAPPSTITTALRTPQRDQHHVFTPKDFEVFCARLLVYTRQSSRAARAALKRGGYVWRACNRVAFSIILDGPVVWSTDPDEYILAVDPTSGIEYVDEKLTEKELELFCGMYNCSTGRGLQVAKRSWYPFVGSFENSGQDYGMWTENSENVFKIFCDNMPTRQPLPISKWTKQLKKGSTQLRKILAASNEVADKLIEDVFVAWERVESCDAILYASLRVSFSLHV
ncbi:hypothetical protein D9613_001483 [Agrocybe pediades]|uniref:Uncharacterized protein n=1 Tax=Agrocybe pediades TaxID=84607 RepID=A0A8H4R4X9_9AGAR|nr:hypothetical protein D9613_001483 [Agrocybe pediades]